MKRRHGKVVRWRLPIVALALLLTAGCTKVTAENYARLKVGMAYQEVTGILGTPAGCDQAAGIKRCRWGDEERHIAVQFAADRVLLYSARGIR